MEKSIVCHVNHISGLYSKGQAPVGLGTLFFSVGIGLIYAKLESDSLMASCFDGRTDYCEPQAYGIAIIMVNYQIERPRTVRE